MIRCHNCSTPMQRASGQLGSATLSVMVCPKCGSGRACSEKDAPKRPEHVEQTFLFRRIRENEERVPILQLVHAIPNGGFRGKKTAVDMWEEGVRKGVPDISIPAARDGFHGLYIEMKVEGKYPTPDQRRFMKMLREEGFRCEVCRTCEEAWELICTYLQIGHLVSPEVTPRPTST